MDIELPHHPIENRRDFFIHLFTITCGLLIALALEGLVEWGHHRTLVHEARVNIRREITANRDAARKNIESVDKELSETTADIKTERQMETAGKHFHGSLGFSFTWSHLSEAAWQTARDTGALSYMPYAEVQRYADLYADQQDVNAAEKGIYEDDAQAYSVIASQDMNAAMPPPAATRLIDATAMANTHLLFLKQTVSQLRDHYTKTLDTR